MDEHGNTTHAPCPVHTGHWHHKSTGACTCGAAHSGITTISKPTVEVVADEMEPDAWHINVNLPLIRPGTTVFVSFAEHSRDDNYSDRYTDLWLRDGHITVLNAGGS